MCSIVKKNALKLTIYGTTPHLHIILTNPIISNPAKVAIVNVTTSRGLPKEDPTVILDVGDHPYITQRSYVTYNFAQIINVNVLQDIIDKGNAELFEDIEDGLFDRILDGIQTSSRTSFGVQAFCRKNC